MALQTTTIKNALATTYTTNCTYGALTSSAPGSTTGTEISGGGYARIASAWGTVTAGVVSATAMAFNVNAGTTVVGFEFFNAITAGTYMDGVGITSQTFASTGTYTITPTFTET